MQTVFHFFLRLLLAFFLARLLLRPVGGDALATLGLALLLVAGSYLWPPLAAGYRRYCQPWCRRLGWHLSRALIALNRLRRRSSLE